MIKDINSAGAICRQTYTDTADSACGKISEDRNPCGALKTSANALFAGIRPSSQEEFKFSKQYKESLLLLPDKDLLLILKFMGINFDEIILQDGALAGGVKLTENEFIKKMRGARSDDIFNAVEIYANKSGNKDNIIEGFKIISSAEFQDEVKKKEVQWFINLLNARGRRAPYCEIFKIFEMQSDNALEKADCLRALESPDFESFCLNLEKNYETDPFKNLIKTLNIYLNQSVHSLIGSQDAPVVFNAVKKYFPGINEFNLTDILDWFIPFTACSGDVVLNSAYIPKPTAQDFEKNADCKGALYQQLSRLCKFKSAEDLAHFLWKSDDEVKKLIQNFDGADGKYLTQKYADEFNTISFMDFMDHSINIFSGLDKLKINAKEADDFINLLSPGSRKAELSYLDFKEFIELISEKDIDIKSLRENKDFKNLKNRLPAELKMDYNAIKAILLAFCGKNDAAPAAGQEFETGAPPPCVYDSFPDEKKSRIKNILADKFGFNKQDVVDIIESITAPEDESLVNNILDNNFSVFYKNTVKFFYGGALYQTVQGGARLTHNKVMFAEISELYDEVKNNPELKDALLPGKFEEAARYLREKLDITRLHPSILPVVLRISVNLDKVKALVEKLENEYGQRVAANDLYLLAEISRRDDLQKLLFNPEAMFEKIKDLFSKAPSPRKNFDLKCPEFDVVNKLEQDHIDPEITAKVSGYVKTQAAGYKERPSAEELKKWPLLNLLRLCLLKEFLGKKENLKALGVIAARDFADLSTEYGGEFRFDKKRGLIIKNIKSIVSSNASYANNKYRKLTSAAFTFHCHIMKNMARYTGPSGTDARFMEDSDSSDVVINLKEKFKGSDGKEYMRVNIDFYFVDKKDPRNPQTRIFDTGDYTVELP